MAQPLFDSHADIRSIRRASASAAGGDSGGLRIAQPRAAATGPNVSLSLQLEQLAEEDSD